MKIALDLSSQEAEQLEKRAKVLGVTVTEAARRALVEALEYDRRFTEAADSVLAENQELYKRLS